MNFRPDWEGFKCFARSLDFILKVVRDGQKSVLYKGITIDYIA